MIVIERRGNRLYKIDKDGNPTAESFCSKQEAMQHLSDSTDWGIVNNIDQRNPRPLTEQQLIERAKQRKPRTFGQRYKKHSPHRFWKRAERRTKNFRDTKQTGL